jgi:hypothetical protein
MLSFLIADVMWLLRHVLVSSFSVYWQQFKSTNIYITPSGATSTRQLNAASSQNGTYVRKRISPSVSFVPRIVFSAVIQYRLRNTKLKIMLTIRKKLSLQYEEKEMRIVIPVVLLWIAWDFSAHV